MTNDLIVLFIAPVVILGMAAILIHLAKSE